MSRQTTISVAVAIAAMLSATPVAAAPKTFRPAFMPAGDAADAPAGFVEMCERDQPLCLAGNPSPTAPTAQLAAWRPAQPGSPVATPASPTPSDAVGFGTSALTGKRPSVDRSPSPRGDDDEAALIRRINSQTNRAVEQVSDLALTGQEEYWERPDPRRPAGDCEDIAIEKRMRLLAAGFPASRMFFAVAFRTGVGLHTVLIARMRDGDYVLDSLNPHLLRWTKTRYSWLRLQSPTDPRVWTRFGAPSPTPLS